MQARGWASVGRDNSSCPHTHAIPGGSRALGLQVCCKGPKVSVGTALAFEFRACHKAITGVLVLCPLSYTNPCGYGEPFALWGSVLGHRRDQPIPMGLTEQ